MLDHCDFSRADVTGKDGRLRPDLLVRLPGGKKVVVDAKAPLEAYLKAVQSSDERRAEVACATMRRRCAST